MMDKLEIRSEGATPVGEAPAVIDALISLNQRKARAHSVFVMFLFYFMFFVHLEGTHSPDLVLNVTTKTDTIWSFSSHVTILSSSDASESDRCSSWPGGRSWSAGVLGGAGGAPQPGPPLHPDTEHPAAGERLLPEGLASRSSPASSAAAAASPGFSADGASSQSSRGARSDRSTILSARPPRCHRRS